jgi:uncharacterized caspase-like protein
MSRIKSNRVIMKKRNVIPISPRTIRIYGEFLILGFSVLGFSLSPVSANTDCDKAHALLVKGEYGSKKEDALQYYMEAIKLCPGFIRPYELIGNRYRKEGQNKKAIEFFTKAANLGSTNHKLYYLLSKLLFEEGNIDEASKYLGKSISIREDYPKAMALKAKIEKATDREGPKIALYEPPTRRGISIVSNYENTTVRGVAIDKSGISWVRVNRLDAPVDQDGNFLKDILLQVGTNTITVEAADVLGNRSRISVTVERKKPVTPPMAQKVTIPRTSDLYGKSFAVVIGINNYEKWSALEFAVRDAKAVREKFEESGFDDITTILDREATQRRILTELFDRLPKKTGRNDRVVIFFAGHGQTEDLPNGGKKGYLIPVDADTSNYFTTAISMGQIRELSKHISAKHILYVMDSCYSGLGLNRSFGVSPNIGGYLRKVGSMRVVQIITAGGKDEQVQEKEGHGLFTRYFLKALEGEADINNDDVVTGTELGAYIRPTVSAASKQAQTPLYGRLEGEGEFLFFVGRR